MEFIASKALLMFIPHFSYKSCATAFVRVANVLYVRIEPPPARVYNINQPLRVTVSL
jgi:hypothetical protein